MKVCPKCEFIYEDDQGLCDMDGAHLVFDPTPMALAIQDPAGLVKPRWRSFAGTAVIGVILGPLLFLVYHVSARRAAPPDINYSAAQVANGPGTDSAAPNADLEAPVSPTTSKSARPTDSSAASSDASQAESESEPSGSEIAGSPELLKPSAKAASNVAPSVNLSSAPSRPSATNREERKRRPARGNREPKDAHQKRESKINSFLKKTGHILKKPFKF